MERYEAYKDSGVEWIGEIPSTWTLARTKAVFSSKKRVVGDKANEYQRLALTMHGVLLRDKDDNEGLQPEQFEGYQILEANELVFKLIDLENIKTSRVGLSPYTGIVSPAYITLTQTDSDNRYFYYWFFALYQQNVFNQLGGNGVRSALNKDDLLNLPMLLPKQDEQRAIANYLDAKTTEIDALVTDCEREVALLQEYRKAVIFEAVTKGLDPGMPMKDSGVEWIGEIPDGWACIKAKHVVRISNGSDPQTEGDIPVFGSGESSFKTCGEYKEPPATLIGRKGATLHIPHYMTERYWNVDTAFNVNATSGYLDKYYYYVAMNFDYRFYLSHTTLPSMTQTAYENMFVPQPSLDEQRRIIDYLDAKTAEIDSLIEAKQEMADKLREYRKSLVSEAVTGKFKVPGV